MLRFVSRPHILPFLIPDVDDDLLEVYLAQCAAIVLQGGSDMAPASYGETPIQVDRWPGDAYRDRYEFKIIDYAIKNNLPIFGICRGFQVLNAFFAGTLYQDISTQLNSSITHRDAVKYDQIKHQVKLSDNGLLQKIYAGAKNIQVNSVHHQAIKKLGTDLVVDAICPEDGIIEGFYHKKIKNIMAVQWHPEFSPTLGSAVADPTPLYDYFLSLF